VYGGKGIQHIKVTKQEEILNLKRRIRLHRKQTNKFAKMVSEIHFDKYKHIEIIDIMRAVYREVFNEKEKF
tara:strand:+ start:14 stop:226 length:213 start_codon:yes stop_codon:yes gene_type:complete